jgi:hypothetical protein
VHNVSDDRQIEVRTAEPLVPGPSRLEIEIAIAKLKKDNRQVVIKFWHNLFKQDVNHYTAIHKLANSIWNKEELLDQWKEFIIVPVHKKCVRTD